MATEAISETTPIHCGHHFSEVLSQNAELSPEKYEMEAFINVHGYHGNADHVANGICCKTPAHGGNQLSEV
jgi:hypothetical protein